MCSLAATAAHRGSALTPNRRLASVAISRLRRATALVYASSSTPTSPSATDTTSLMSYRSRTESNVDRLTQKVAVSRITGKPRCAPHGVAGGEVVLPLRQRDIAGDVDLGVRVLRCEMRGSLAAQLIGFPRIHRAAKAVRARICLGGAQRAGTEVD